MPVNKPHLEFHTVDMASGWETPPGYPEGIEQKILAGALDEERHQGNRTRLLRFRPGVFTTAPFVHDYWEEVFLVEGDLTVGNDAHGHGGENSRPAPMPAGRPARRTARSSLMAAACCSRSTITGSDAAAQERLSAIATIQTRQESAGRSPVWRRSRGAAALPICRDRRL